MRASELTLGSWVIATNNGVCPLPDKIAKMLPRAGRIVNLDYDLVVLDFMDFGLMLDAIEPVPLTPEILEKNGFKFDGSGQCSMMFLSKPQFAEGLRFNIYVGLKRKTIEVFAAHPIEKSPNWRKSNKVYLEVCGCYVHELQQALQLCGIKKEVEL